MRFRWRASCGLRRRPDITPRLMRPRQISKGGTRGSVYRVIGQLRLRDAAFLLRGGRYQGAIYVAGYAIECHLKFAVCERKGFIHLPAVLEVHDWDALLIAGGLSSEIQAERRMSGIYSALAEAWGPSLRYRTAAYAPGAARRLYSEFETLYQFLAELVP